MARVLVTGASGFIGRHTVGALRAAGFDVHETRRSQGVDLLERGAAARLVARVRPTHLVHLAWHTDPSSYADSAINESWVAATVELGSAFAALPGAGRMVSVGTCAEYDWSAGRCDERSTPLAPATRYGRAKRDAHARLADIGGLSLAHARVFFVHGPGEHPDRLVPSVARALLTGVPVAVSTGQQRRDYLHAADVGDALAALLASGVEGAVNVGSGHAVPVRRVVEIMADQLGGRDLVGWGERAAGDEAVLVEAVIGRLAEQVGWQPSRSLEEGVRATADWWRSAYASG